MTSQLVSLVVEKLVHENAVDVIEAFGLSLHFVLDKKFGESIALGNLRREYFRPYLVEVSNTISQKEFRRREYLENYPLPGRKVANIRPLANKIVASMEQMPFEDALSFLGQLTGAWILTCPTVIVRDEYTRLYRGKYGWVDSESFVVSTLMDWLHRELEYMYT